MFQVNKHLSKPGHPWRKFGTGNIESLSRAAKELHKKGLLKENSAAQLDTVSASNTPVTSRPDTPTSSAPSSVELEGDGGVVGREIRRRLIEWWKAEYSANRMRLCVVGKGKRVATFHSVKIFIMPLEPLDELSDIVSTLFSPILNKPVEALPLIKDHPFGPDEMGVSISLPHFSIIAADKADYLEDYGFRSNDNECLLLRAVFPDSLSSALLEAPA